jgi:hypothetical protein
VNIVEYDEIRAKLDEVKEAADFIPDVSNDEGYNKSKRVSLDIGKLLTALEKKRKDKKAYFLQGGRDVDSQAKTIAEELEAYQAPHKIAYKEYDDAKKQREKERKRRIEERVEYLENLPEIMRDSKSEEIKLALDKANDEECLDFYEYTERALKARNKAQIELADLYDRARQYEHDQAELKRLQKEAAERAEREHEEMIRREAAAKAEAEKKAAEERERLAKEAEERAKQEAIEAEERARQAAIQADQQAKAAEEQRKRDAEEAEKRRIEAEKVAAEAARQAEIKRQQEEQERIRREQEQREANKRHVGDVRRKAKEALIAECGLSEDVAKKVILAINSKKIPNVTIQY